ncbi:hypothetical protein PDK03_07720 [Bacillus cereus group sp. TH204-1LC]|uniref:hypothetical protein n=1 Tax=Bacillus cereus group sp. TH204-1LC TaxID=3018054 RepID=UPI0022E980E9|nr:hypothetical protein [Bacillus cereus group sp. TH204-1LC]MDA1616469.1 hypothetical protein [Bacillus cereus group sp. TH204-1LC]
MSNNEKSEKKEDVFEETFGGLLDSNKKEPDAVVHQPENKLEDVLFGEEENNTLSHEEAEKAAENYIPPSIGDEQWEQFVGRVPLPPINREQESRAVSIGLQEIRKMKEYMLYIHRHMINEFNRIYASFPILFAKDFEDKFGTAHKELVTIMEDIEHLVAGDIDHVEAVKNDFKLTQIFEEKRLSLLYDLLEHYNKKK